MFGSTTFNCRFAPLLKVTEDSCATSDGMPVMSLLIAISPSGSVTVNGFVTISASLITGVAAIPTVYSTFLPIKGVMLVVVPMNL